MRRAVSVLRDSERHQAQEQIGQQRDQQREDGISWDQIVISSATYKSSSPGSTRGDVTMAATQGRVERALRQALGTEFAAFGTPLAGAQDGDPLHVE